MALCLLGTICFATIGVVALRSTNSSDGWSGLFPLFGGLAALSVALYCLAGLAGGALTHIFGDIRPSMVEAARERARSAQLARLRKQSATDSHEAAHVNPGKKTAAKTDPPQGAA